MEGYKMLGRIQIYVIGSIILFVVLTGIYYSWRKSIEREALLEYNQKQIEQNIKDQEELHKKMEAVKQQQEEILRKNEEDKKAFEYKINEAIDFVNSEEMRKSDRPASKVLKETVKKLREVSK